MPVTVRGTDILFNDGTTQSTAGSAVNTTTVLNATAGATAGSVGTYAFLGETTNTTTSIGGTRAGSALRYVAVTSTISNAWGVTSLSGIRGQGSTTAPAGTWRAMGSSSIFVCACFSLTERPATLWLRIS